MLRIRIANRNDLGVAEGWASRPGVPKTLAVVDADADSLIDRIDDLSAKSRFVIVDLEGTKNLVVSYAIQKSSLVVIPVKGSQLDAELATEQISMVKMQERVAGRAIPYAVVFTQTRPPLSPKTQRFIEAQFAQLGAPIFDTQLVDREAFRAMFSFGGSLAGLTGRGVSDLPAALANAHAFTQELVDQLRNGNKSVSEAA